MTRLHLALLVVFAILVHIRVDLSIAAAQDITWSSGVSPILGFEEGDLGRVPEGWYVTTPGWAAELTNAQAADRDRSLALAPRAASDAPFGSVMRVLDAAPYRGTRVRLSAKIRVEGGEGQAMMWLRADLDDGTTGAFYNMHDRPILPAPEGETAWSDASFELDIERNAARLALGFLSFGGATLLIDAVRLDMIETPPGAEPQEPSEPRPLSPRGIENLEAATRLLAYVRFFHASDQAASSVSWDHVAVALVDAAEPAIDAADLAQRLGAFFAPLAPTLQVWAGGPEAAPPRPEPPSGVERIVFWRHTGAGGLPGGIERGVYESKVERERLPASLPWGRRTLDPDTHAASFVVKPLGAGVTCRLPVRIYADAEGTLPHVPEASEWNVAGEQPRLTAENRSTRLAGVALCWGVMQHFYPYFDVVETDWDAALGDALRSAAEDADERSYLHTLQSLIAKLHDGHGYAISVRLHQDSMIPLAFAWAGDDLVVAGTHPSVSDEVAVGDIVLAVEGRPITQWCDILSTRISAATDGWRRFRLLRELPTELPTPERVRVALRRPGGFEYQADLMRIPPEGIKAATDHRPGDGREVAPGIVYFNLNSAATEALEAAMPALAAARGIVFDMRGYPGDAGSKVLGHLSKVPLRSARWNVPVVTLPDREGWEWNTGGRWFLQPAEPYLDAEIAFLTDGRAISYAESVLGIVEAYGLGEIVGAATAGTNGNVNPFDLPGGYHALWTGMKVLKHDGSRHHGVGIAPTVPVEPTAAGIAAGRDEVLEKAIEVLQAKFVAESGD